jgi:hypothetical protein
LIIDITECIDQRENVHQIKPEYTKTWTEIKLW